MTTTLIPNAVRWSALDSTAQKALLQRPVQRVSEALQTQVASLINEVENFGDRAVLECTERFDGVKLASPELPMSQVEALAATITPEVRAAIDRAYDNIYQFHAAQQPQNVTVNTSPGVTCTLNFTAFASVGLYIPGGSASLPSTALMLGVPAQIANCDERVLVSPPAKDGTLSPAICYAAVKCGMTRVFLMGGAQAIAALALGTETIPAVQKIFGPGNSYVTEAKQQVSQLAGGPAIDLPAGPSELLVIADASAEPAFVAADLLSQAEHGPDSQVILLSPDVAFIERVRAELALQLEKLPRAEIAAEALKSSSLILTESLSEAIAISEAYAPEHLSIQLNNAEHLIPRLRNAGSIFVGHYTPESGGDYATGTNHVLPTYGFARSYSSLGLLDFYRRFTTQTVSAKGLMELGPAIVELAREEKLDAHLRAVSLRLESDRIQRDVETIQ
ncbi:MAG: histidinol dehydrogenase HisD [Idiomarinaceae bacterium HL-53]|nr:MAG: histidinol dehydrogenase HisD [Idiomarinaceae bacterium HL-53]CUS48583.1 histidinol dehydrogenase [Idiomarinaceae bacterium HL-53]